MNITAIDAPRCRPISKNEIALRPIPIWLISRLAHIEYCPHRIGQSVKCRHRRASAGRYAAVPNQPGTAAFHLGANDYTSWGDTVTIPKITLYDLCRDYDIEQIDVLKIDTKILSLIFFAVLNICLMHQIHINTYYSD